MNIDKEQPYSRMRKGFVNSEFVVILVMLILGAVGVFQGWNRTPYPVTGLKTMGAVLGGVVGLAVIPGIFTLLALAFKITADFGKWRKSRRK